MRFEFYFISSEGYQKSEHCAVEVVHNEIPADVIKNTIYAKGKLKPIHADWCDELFTYGGSTFTNGKHYAHVKNIGNEIYVYEMT